MAKKILLYIFCGLLLFSAGAITDRFVVNHGITISFDNITTERTAASDTVSTVNIINTDALAEFETAYKLELDNQQMTENTSTLCFSNTVKTSVENIAANTAAATEKKQTTTKSTSTTTKKTESKKTTTKKEETKKTETKKEETKTSTAASSSTASSTPTPAATPTPTPTPAPAPTPAPTPEPEPTPAPADSSSGDGEDIGWSDIYE